MTAMPTTFTYAGRALPYSARFSDRTTLEISVLPDGDVEVVAPIGTAREAIESRLRKRGKWILAQQRYFHQFKPRIPARRFVGGETHLYLGRQYRLKLSAGTVQSVKLKAAVLGRDGRSSRRRAHRYWRTGIGKRRRSSFGSVMPQSLRNLSA